MRSHSTTASVVIRIRHWIRDGWLIVGLTLALFLSLELLYRGQRALRDHLAEKRERAEPPITQETWWPEWLRNRSAMELQFDSYSGWVLKPFTSRYFDVDSAGHRRTVQSVRAAGQPRSLFMVGGSTMWGYATPDSLTIPSLVASELHDRGLRDVRLVNLAQQGLTATEGIIALLHELRRGNVPEAAVFLDGFNDVVAALQAGSAGHMFRAPWISRRWMLGGRGLAGELIGMERHSKLIARLRRLVGADGREPGSPPEPHQLCKDVGLHYRAVVRSGEALGQEFGFHVFFLWQPLLATSRKPLTAWERSLPPWSSHLPAGGPGIRPQLRLCTATVDSLMQDRMGRTYVPLHTLYDADSTAIFVDDVHLTVDGNRKLAEQVADLVAPVLLERMFDERVSSGGAAVRSR